MWNSKISEQPALQIMCCAHLCDDDGKGGHGHDALHVQQRRLGGRPAGQALGAGATRQLPVEAARVAAERQVRQPDAQADKAQDQECEAPALPPERVPRACASGCALVSFSSHVAYSGHARLGPYACGAKWHARNALGCAYWPGKRHLHFIVLSCVQVHDHGHALGSLTLTAVTMQGICAA